MLSPIELDDDTLEVVVGLMEDDVEQEATVPDNEVVVACESFCSFVFFVCVFCFLIHYFVLVKFVLYVSNVIDMCVNVMMHQNHMFPSPSFFYFHQYLEKKYTKEKLNLWLKKIQFLHLYLKTKQSINNNCSNEPRIKS